MSIYKKLSRSAVLALVVAALVAPPTYALDLGVCVGVNADCTTAQDQAAADKAAADKAAADKAAADKAAADKAAADKAAADANSNLGTGQASSAEPRLTGMSEYSNTMTEIGDRVTIYGVNLNLVTSCTIDGIEVEMIDQSPGSITFAIPKGLEPGPKNLVMTWALGTMTSERVLTLLPEGSSKVNAGAFDGFVAVYAKGLKGKTLTWKIAGKWVTKTVTSDYQVFVRKTIDVDRDVFVDIYIDGVMTLERIINTK
jgi:hypothetical protein